MSSINPHAQLNEKSRVKLVEWLIEMHSYLNLVPETLYLTISIIDRYYSDYSTGIIRKDFSIQLVGVAALFIASKFEEIYPPELRDFAFITKGKCTKEEILIAESDILRKLDFSILVVSPLLLFNRFYFITAKSKDDLKQTRMSQIYYLCHFIMELCLIEYSMLKYSPSIIASAALFVSRRIFTCKPSWPQVLDSFSLIQSSVLQCAKEILCLLKKERNCSIGVLKKKYSKECFMNVYNIVTGGGQSKASSPNTLKQQLTQPGISFSQHHLSHHVS